MKKKQHFNKKKEQSASTNARSKHRQVFNKPEVRRDFSLNLAITPGKKWVEYRTDFESQTVQSITSSDAISNLKMEAQNFIIADSKLYKKYNEKRKEKADFAWIHTILYSGTLSDKISAHILLIQDSAVYNLSSIEVLVGMVNIKGKRECLLAMDCLRDLFLSDLLVEDKKLKFFDQQPLRQLDELTDGNSDARKKQLIAWFFEDKLKSIYGTFLKNLELVSHDKLEKTKQKAVSVMYELMKCNPEQEQYLLEHIVNKIGDPVKKVCGHVCFLLGQLVDCHPNMKYIVAQEVERLLFRPKIAERTKYYCLCFLNQLILSSEDTKLATRLIMIYFSLFKTCTKKGEVNTKMMGALLSGVARAYPFASLADSVFHEQLDNMYKLVHIVSFNISIQALMIIFQVLNSKDSISDRFYCTLYRKLFDPAIGSSTRQSMLLNLVNRALKKDVAGKRVKAFVKRLLQIAIYQAPHLQCGILYVISEVAKIHTDLFKLVSAFELDSDEEEHYEDVVDDDDKIISENEIPSSNLFQSSAENLKNCPSSWVHKEIQKPTKSSYDPQCRNPLHAGAEYCNLWELRYLKNCFHPSVSLFAHQVSARNEIKYSGDPLQDFTLVRFLDRFVYRNPKKVPEGGVTDMHRQVFGSRGLYTPSGSRNLAVTSDAYLNQKEGNVPAEEDFIFRFLRQQMTEGKLKRGDDSDIESVNSDEFEGLLDKYNVANEGKDALDFVKELTDQKKKAGKKQKEDPSNEEMEDGFDSLEDDSDMDEPDFENDEDFQKAFEDFDDEFEGADKTNHTFAFEEGGDFPHKSSKAERRKPKSLKSLDPGSLFAAADEFSTLLEDNINSNIDNSTTDAFVNKDKSDPKQILWERQRDRHVKGKSWKRHKGQKFRKKNVFKRNKK